MKKLIFLLSFVAFGQVARLDRTNTFTSRQDASGAASTAPIKSGTSLPGTCTVNDLFYKSNATSGQRIYACETTNTWVLQGDGNSGGGGGITLPMVITRSSSGTVLTIGSDCNVSVTNPCLVRVGSIVFTYTTSATATITSLSGLAYIYVDKAGIITVAIASGTVVCNGCTAVTGTQFPVDSVPISTWNATTNVWDATATEKHSILSVGRNFTAGSGISLVESGSNVQISATGGTSSYDPMDLTKIFNSYIWAEGIADGARPWTFSAANCTGATAVSTVVAGEPYAVHWTGANCFVWWPGMNGGVANAFPVKDFISGGTPKTHTFTARLFKEAAAGDYYIGWSSGSITFPEFVGIRYKQSTNKWQCVIRGASTDVSTQDSNATPDTVVHTFSITNGGSANSITCSIDGTAWTSVTGTIPAANWFAIIGTSTAANGFATVEARILITGISR